MHVPDPRDQEVAYRYFSPFVERFRDGTSVLDVASGRKTSFIGRFVCAVINAFFEKFVVGYDLYLLARKNADKS